MLFQCNCDPFSKLMLMYVDVRVCRGYVGTSKPASHCLCLNLTGRSTKKQSNIVLATVIDNRFTLPRAGEAHAKAELVQQQQQQQQKRLSMLYFAQFWISLLGNVSRLH